VYLAAARYLYEYDFPTNRVLTVDQNGDSLPPAYATQRTVVGLTYYDGSVWILASGELREIDWASRSEIAYHDLRPFGIPRPRGLEVIGDTIYIVDGNYPHRIFEFQAIP